MPGTPPELVTTRLPGASSTFATGVPVGALPLRPAAEPVAAAGLGAAPAPPGVDRARTLLHALRARVQPPLAGRVVDALAQVEVVEPPYPPAPPLVGALVGADADALLDEAVEALIALAGREHGALVRLRALGALEELTGGRLTPPSTTGAAGVAGATGREP